MPDDRALLERQMADVELRSFTLDEFHRRRHRKQRNRRIATAGMGLALVAIVAGGVGVVVSDDGERTITADDTGSGALPRSPFVGSWESIDADGSSQTMEIELSSPDRYEVVGHDDAATACSGAPSTLVGVGRLETDRTLVVDAELTCDDGTVPVPLGDPETARELVETLAGLRFTHDPATDELTDGFGVVWHHPGAAPDPRPRDEVGPVLEPPSPFVGSWESIDADGSSQTLMVRHLGGADRHEIVLRDETAAACSDAASTLTGTGRRQTGAGWRAGLVELVMAAELTCDDGTTPRVGSELREALAHVSFVHDPVTEELIDSFEVVWRRPGAARDQGDPSATLERLADALTAGDADAFLDVFSPDGAFNPRGEFASSEQPLANVFPVSERRLVEVWVAINETWGFEADLRTCSSVSAPQRRFSGSTDVFIECAVTARWTELSLEITDGWRFELRGARLVAWDVAPLDLDPADRTMPLGYPGLEAWEAWLETTHPDDAARWLNPRSEPADEPATRSWVIEGERFTPEGLIPYDPAYVDEIGASIEEYLDDR